MDGREHYYFILISSIMPLVGVVIAIVLGWNHVVGPWDIVLLLVLNVITGLGITIGYHRLLTHRSFAAGRGVRMALVAAGAMAAQAPPIIWVAHHRRHHQLADKPGDPHSPHLDHDPNLRGVLRGLWHAHLGWLFAKDLTSDPLRYCPDVARDPDVRFISRHFVLFVAGGLILPGLLGLALTGSVLGAATGVLWGGLVRIFIGNHVTYAVNSVGHYFGSRRFPTRDESRNVAWLALPSFGEAWHNNHHAFPRSASHGLRWYEVDVSAAIIALLEKVGLAWDVVRVGREAQEKRIRNRHERSVVASRAPDAT